jgi:hypothetical protein
MITRTGKQSQTTTAEAALTPVEIATIERDVAQRNAALLLLPCLSDPDCAAVVKVPISTWYQFKDTLGLRQFCIGRRKFTLTKDLLAALEARAAATQA